MLIRTVPIFGKRLPHSKIQGLPYFKVTKIDGQYSGGKSKAGLNVLTINYNMNNIMTIIINKMFLLFRPLSLPDCYKNEWRWIMS